MANRKRRTARRNRRQCKRTSTTLYHFSEGRMMLFTTKNAGESVVIKFGGATATVTVLSKQGQQVRLGIHAPPEVIVVCSGRAATKEQERG